MEHISKAQIKFIRSLQQKKVRDEQGLFVAEGRKCVEELQRGFELVMLVRESENATRTEIEQMSSLRTPQGVIGVFRKERKDDWGNGQTILVLDGIQDPGNLGTIIRTCDWFGVHTVVCSRNTADCYNPKVVQATMGALARVQLRYVNLTEWLNDFKKQYSGLRIYGTLLDGKNIYEVLDREFSQPGGSHSPTVPNVIIMGNEGNGISEAVRTFITHPIYIPSYTQNKETSDVVESLNVSVATAIVLAEFRRIGAIR